MALFNCYGITCTYTDICSFSILYVALREVGVNEAYYYYDCNWQHGHYEHTLNCLSLAEIRLKTLDLVGEPTLGN